MPENHAQEAAPCAHFGQCGGCSFEIWDTERYRLWKQERIEHFLKKAGFPNVQNIHNYPLPSRRRIILGAEKTQQDLKLGYHAPRNSTLFDLAACSIALPALSQSVPGLRSLLQIGLPSKGKARVHLTQAQNGIDCTIQDDPPTSRLRLEAANLASNTGFIRLTWNDDPLFLKDQPYIYHDQTKVFLPALSFLQAVEACEKDMIMFAKEALSATSGPICDLFCGLGAFTFSMAKHLVVHSYEFEMQAILALKAATRTANGLKPIKAIRRDLFRNPLSPLELNAFEAAIINPPREGAIAQFENLAASRIQTIVVFSCNPGTFVRDARCLISRGFEITKLSGFDQFPFSSHIELGALFVRHKTEKGRVKTRPRINLR